MKTTIKMDRERVKPAGIILFTIVLLLLFSSSALGLGVAPSRKVISYDGQEEIQMRAAIINNEGHDMKVLLMPKGELSEYIKLSNSVVRLRADQSEITINYKLELPEDIALKPGENMIRLAMIELPDELKDQVVVMDGEVITLSEENPTISATTAVIQQIVLNVPYPDSYAQGKLYVTGNKVGEEVKFSISVFNKGAADLDVKGYVRVKGPTNEEIVRLDAGEAHVAGMDESRLVAVWSGVDNPGEYIAEAVVTYGGKSFITEEKFLLGQPQISIERLNVKAFRLGTIAKFDVDVLSRWNRQIKDIEGEMRVLDKDGGVVSSFETTRVDLPAQGMRTISGYWDTEGISIGEYDVNILLSYEGRTTQKLFETVVSIDQISVKEPISTVGRVLDAKSKGGQYTFLIILVMGLLVLNGFIFMYFRKLKGALMGGRRMQPPRQQAQQQEGTDKQAPSEKTFQSKSKQIPESDAGMDGIKQDDWWDKR